MLKAFIALLLFVACHITSSVAALLWLNRENLVRGLPMDSSLLTAHPEKGGIALLVGTFITTALLVATKVARKSSVASLLQPPERSCVPACLSVITLAAGLSFILAPLELPDDGNYQTFLLMKENVLNLFLLGMAGPVFEELVFREGILRHLSCRMMPPVAAALASALLFGAVHNNWAQLVPAVILGFLFGLFYIRTGNIRLSCYAHILNNCLALFLMNYPATHEGLAALPTATGIAAGSLCIAASIVLFGIWWKMSVPPPAATSEQ